MYKKILFIFIIYFFTACGGGSTSESTLIPENNETIPTEDFNESNETNIATNVNPLFYQQWYLDKNDTFYSANSIDDDAHIHMVDDNITGNGVVVAIIDNGFDVTHPDIASNIIATRSFSTNRWGNIFTSEDVSHSLSTDYHGTSVAGIVAAFNNDIGIKGVAPNVDLVLIKMPTSFTDEVYYAMFDYAVSQGAQVISCSWGTGNVSQDIRDYINQLVETTGVIIVFAAGNSDALIEDDESSIKNVIAVGATDKDNLRTAYSSYGKELDIVAPGGYSLGITTIDPLGADGAVNGDYIEYDDAAAFVGTSAAAPIVSGSIALLLEKEPSFTFFDVLEKIKLSSDHIGQDTPYLDEIISSNSDMPNITGIFGVSGFDQFELNITNQSSSLQYGPYPLGLNGDNTFFVNVTDSLVDGNYTLELFGTADATIFATDELLIIDQLGENISNPTIKKSDFYGYGKLNVTKLLE